MNTSHYKQVCFRYCIGLSVLLISGCVAWVDRPPPSEALGIEPAGENSSTITVVRRKQFALSGVIFTISIDGMPVANLESGEYTSFQISQNEHILQVRWDIGGLNIIGAGPGGAGFISDPVRTYEKGIAVKCRVGAICFITVESKAFAKQEEDRVILNQVSHLEGDFSLEDMMFVSPGVVKPE